MTNNKKKYYNAAFELLNHNAINFPKKIVCTFLPKTKASTQIISKLDVLIVKG